MRRHHPPTQENTRAIVQRVCPDVVEKGKARAMRALVPLHEQAT